MSLVWYVDDRFHNHENIRTWLELLGHTVRCFDDYQEYFDAKERDEHPDIFLAELTVGHGSNPASIGGGIQVLDVWTDFRNAESPTVRATKLAVEGYLKSPNYHPKVAVEFNRLVRRIIRKRIH